MKYLLAGILLLLAGTSSGESLTLTTPRGAKIDVIAQLPEGTGPFTTVVLAPGQGYHMQLPALEKTAQRLLAAGFAVFRFNWAYYTSTPQGNLSNEFVLEIEDMNAVVALAKSDTRVDSERIWAAGKSLGSSVAWHVLKGDSSLKGGALLTPVCSQAESGNQEPTPIHDYYYPSIDEETRPLVFVVGDSDPLCSPSILYRLISELTGPSRLAVVGGDHSFENLPLSGNEAFEKNLRLIGDFVALAIADWSVTD
ncbi:MAG: alpha/beta family hydrolase [Gammaproteobacteria bacterium]